MTPAVYGMKGETLGIESSALIIDRLTAGIAGDGCRIGSILDGIELNASGIGCVCVGIEVVGLEID